MARPATGQTYDLAFFVAFLLVAAGGAFMAVRLPDNRIGWLVLAEGASWLLAGVLVSYANVALPSRAATVSAWIANWEWIIPIGLVGVIFLLFPTGHLPSKRWRVVVWAGILAAAVTVVVAGFTPGPLPEAPAVENPFGAPSMVAGLAVLGVVAPALTAVVLCVALASVVVRFRRANGLERRQLAWLALAAVAIAVAFTIANVLEAAGVGKRLPDELRGSRYSRFPSASRWPCCGTGSTTSTSWSTRRSSTSDWSGSSRLSTSA
jgi:hypothetical protein